MQIARCIKVANDASNKRASKEAEKLDHDAEKQQCICFDNRGTFWFEKVRMYIYGRRCAEKYTLLPQ
jgi:hypothetical protein